MNDTYKAYKGHNSPYLFEITDVLGNRYSATQMAAITRMYLKYIPATGEAAEYADSDGSGHEDCFDWDTYASTGRARIDIGLLDFTAGRDLLAEVVVYDADYPNGRVVDQIDLYVSEEADGDLDLVNPLSALLSKVPLTITEDTTLTVDQLGRSIRVNGSSLITVTMPSLGADEDGVRATFIQQGAGAVKILRADSDVMVAPGKTYITSGSLFAAITLEYVHAITTLVAVDGMGKWTGGPA